MPFANIAVVEGVFSPAEKQQLMTRVAEALISIEGEGLREKTVVILTEVKSGDWCVGGQALTTNEIRRFRKPQGNSPRDSST